MRISINIEQNDITLMNIFQMNVFAFFLFTAKRVN